MKEDTETPQGQWLKKGLCRSLLKMIFNEESMYRLEGKMLSRESRGGNIMQVVLVGLVVLVNVA